MTAGTAVGDTHQDSRRFQLSSRCQARKITDTTSVIEARNLTDNAVRTFCNSIDRVAERPRWSTRDTPCSDP